MLHAEAHTMHASHMCRPMCVQCTSVDPRAMCVAQVARRAMGDGVRTRGDGIVSVQHGRSTLHPRRQPQPLGMGYHPHLSGQRGEGQAAVADERPRCRPLLLPAGLGDQALWTVHCRAAGAPSQGVVTAGGRHIHIYIYICGVLLPGQLTGSGCGRVGGGSTKTRRVQRPVTSTSDRTPQFYGEICHCRSATGHCKEQSMDSFSNLFSSPRYRQKP